ncbi:MAG: hypothetical protein V1790_17495 [Planctomycetota bacterium]
MRLSTLFVFAALALGQTRDVILNWDHPAPGVTFNVYRASGACPTPAVPIPTKINASAVAAKTYTDGGVAYGIYCYQVRAFAGGLESIPSNDAQGDAGPTPPTNLRTTTATAQITVSEKGVLTATLDVQTTPTQ